MLCWDEVPLSGPYENVTTEPAAPPFTMTELITVARRLTGGKAPGPDGVVNKILKIFVEKDAEILLALFNICWGDETFPVGWKRARLVFLYKGNNKPITDPSSFQPISLINTVAKLFKRMVLDKLNVETAEKGGLSTRKYGLRKG